MEALRRQAADPSAWDHEDLTEIKQFFEEKHKKGAAVMSWDEWRMLFSTDEDDSHQQEKEMASQHEQVHGGGDFEDGADLDEEVTYDEVTFRKYDLDGNGVLDKEEVQRMLGRAQALSEVANAADELLAELDLDLDEMVSFSEWISTLY
uniref:EF-hand domain-containing protein n=1 Tax=Pfiesteria piscicida TaxID=71001 RepID=E8Z662_PFIPI|nr:unknown [Pfiesteria piscicida]